MATEEPPPYVDSHIQQAGNHGDVLKHLVLREAIKAQQAAHPEGILFVDTHCGPGFYDLAEQSTGEYEKGIMKIVAAAEDAPDIVKEYYKSVKGFDDYLQKVGAKGAELYHHTLTGNQLCKFIITHNSI